MFFLSWLICIYPRRDVLKNRREGADMVGIISLLTLLLAVSSAANSAELLTKSLAIDRLGFTLHYPESWSGVAQDDHAWMVNAPLEQATGPNLDSLAQIFVTTEHRTNHAEAVNRLREICSEYQTTCTYLAIGGWPAMQREVIAPKEEPGAQEEPANEEMMLYITTAIAAGDLLIRAEGRMPASVSEQVKTQVRAIENGTSLRVVGNPKETQSFIQELQRNPRLTPFSPPPSKVRTNPPPRLSELSQPRVVLKGAGARPEEEHSVEKPVSTSGAGSAGAGVAIVIPGNRIADEPEIAVSTNGLNIVVAQQSHFATSNDGGTTFPYKGKFASSDGGDSSLAYGKSGNFYEGTISKSTSSTALNVSTNNGQTFPFQTNAFTCPATGPNQCAFNSGSPNNIPFPDQEHIAADRYNSSSSGEDQVYFVWRLGNHEVGIACSTTSGTTFGNPTPFAGDFPRITVAPDGFVYVVYVKGGNIYLNKFSSCQNGLSAQTGFPKTVASGIGVMCPVPGLDRCDTGNVLSSQMVAVDDTNANHVYVSYAQSSGNGESIVLQDSVDGGKTWSPNRVVTLSANSVARRFMPWLCTGNGVANVTWYDRRSATGSQNDLTDYYGANACTPSSGNLTAGLEFQLNAPNSADAQCLAGQSVGSAKSWPAGSKSCKDSTKCSKQPQLGGECRQTPKQSTDSKQACNLAGTSSCPIPGSTPTNPCSKPGETCQLAGGAPKYGDYNGNACAAGTLYTVWASATPPPGMAATGNIDLYFASNPISVTKNCTAPDVLAADPSSLSVQAGDGTIGANAASTNLYASGPWASDPNQSPALAFDVIQVPSGVPLPPSGTTPTGVSWAITNNINPPTVKFTAGTNTAPGVYGIAIKGTIGSFQAKALVALTVTACQPVTCAAAGWTCGSFDNGCGGNSSCGTCPSGKSCTAGGCYPTCHLDCESPEFLNPITCKCESCKCGIIILNNGHRICNVCKP
jgi:hypothetical protein